MHVIDGMNMEEVPYFDIFEYISKIELNASVMSHAEETSQDFANYLQLLFQYDASVITLYLADSFQREMVNFQMIENHYIHLHSIKDDFFFEASNICHEGIHKIHRICTTEDSNKQKEYRNVPVRVSRMTPKGEFIFWKAPDPVYVEPFMNDFLKAYKIVNSSMLFSDPFLVSALMHLLFVRIHPYNDGNGRTARVIHNLKFTESINKLYGKNFKLSPLNISGSILINKPTYANRINAIYFDLVHDTNDAINHWFDFVLNMADEQIYYNKNRLHQYRDFLKDLEKQRETYTEKRFVKVGKM